MVWDSLDDILPSSTANDYIYNLPIIRALFELSNDNLPIKINNFYKIRVWVSSGVLLT